MPSNFDLIITADYPNRSAELRLRDESGSQIAYRQTNFNSISISKVQGMIDLRGYIRDLVVEGEEDKASADIGVCIAKDVLGDEIFNLLWASQSQRSLRIQLPGADEVENRLAAALARVPWEIARPSVDEETLGERNLLVRVVHDMKAPESKPLVLGKDESLRVLFVFAEARKSNPLAMRLERLKLRHLFEKMIYPHRLVVADFLTHGVTRERLKEQIADRGGYHIVHWSGHGHLNLLELAKVGGESDQLSGEELLGLFTRAGGFIPRLFFLSACHSGEITNVKNWQEFIAKARGKETDKKQTPLTEEKELQLDVEPGYTGTAHALLRGGVSSVVAMRYAVGDEYARELAIEFYDALLADQKPKSAASALTMARNSLLDSKKHNLTKYSASDHATPVLYGEEQIGLSLPKGRSSGLDTRDPRLHQIVELTTAGHEHFVGRTWELAGMGAEFIGSSRGEEVKPVAVITGLGGMGKTALVAEALSLWESRFEWVLLYQAKPNALNFDLTLRDIHLKLYGEMGRYHEHVKVRRADAIHRDADEGFTGQERLERLTRNLIRALREEPILLVLDNFETNLKPNPESNGVEAVWSCQDPNWDQCLKLLASGLVGTPSRVMITCRKPLAVLSGKPCHRVQLGPLPAGEAALYLREHQGLSRMFFSGDEGERALAMRLLAASRFHPLLMDRLARLATGGESLRPQLLQALESLEKSKDYSQLPGLFTGVKGDATELYYLNDALATSLDQLILDASAEARRLLWVIALANDPVSLDLLTDVWSGESQQEQLQQIKQMLDMLPQLPQEIQEQLKALPPEVRAMIDALPPRPDPSPLLRQLIVVGLVTVESRGPEDNNPFLNCHELVRERVLSWMEDHEQDRGELTENSIRLAYAERLEAMFEALRHRNMTAALDAGSRALVYCVQAGAYERLANFASWVVTSARDPRLLEGLLPHLEAAAESAPEGRPRWRCLGILADALRQAGRPNESLTYYEQAAAQARSAAEAGGDDEKQAWSDLGWISGNWANALREVGDLDSARQRYLDSAEAYNKAGSPAVNETGRELEALRIDIFQGRVEEALPEIERRLARIEGWWKQHLSGQKVAEAPNPEALARAFIGALDIARDAHYSRQDWESALTRIDAILEVQRTLNRPTGEIALARLNLAVVLGCLSRFDEAKSELEDCLQIFHNDPTIRAKVLGSLASLFAAQDDVDQAIRQERRALAISEQLPDPQERATSHNNLASYLDRCGEPSAMAESSRHLLASLIYRLVSGLNQNLQTSLQCYTILFRRSHDSGDPLQVPRLAELLADPAFHSLNEWLSQQQINPGEVQEAVDQFLDQARQWTLQQDEPE